MLLDLLKIRNRRFTCGAYSGVDLAVVEQLAQRLAARVPRHRDRFWHGQGAGLDVGLRCLHRAFDSLHARQVDALLLQQPADSHGDEAVAEGPRGEDRDRDEGAVTGDVARDALGGGELGCIEFLVADHAVEDVAWVVDREEVEVCSFWLHFARYSAFMRSVSLQAKVSGTLGILS